MDKTFLIAGTSTFNNVNTFRFANGKPNLRANMLRFNGHTDIELVELPKPMTKLQAIAYLTQKGTEAVVPTRAKDKLKKPELQLAAEKLAQKRMRDAARKRAKRDAA